MRVPRFSPQTAHRWAVFSLAMLTLVIFTGAAVRLTGSGLACPNWPECNDQVITASQPEWIEFGNRLVSGTIGAIAVITFFVMLLREPRDQTLVKIAALPAIGVAAQGGLGALTVYYELKPGFVIAHFVLSFIILIAAALLVWRSQHPAGSRPASTDRVAVVGSRVLLVLVSLIVVLGTLASGAGPHPGSRATGEVTDRIDWFGGDTLMILIHRHGNLGTATLFLTVGLLAWLTKRGTSPAVRRRLTWLIPVYALQGAVGLYQYYNGLPAEAVWIHIVLATFVWLMVLFTVFEAGRLAPRPAHAEQPAPPASA